MPIYCSAFSFFYPRLLSGTNLIVRFVPDNLFDTDPIVSADPGRVIFQFMWKAFNEKIRPGQRSSVTNSKEAGLKLHP